jgi:predicted enzyme involved in methoxymalonyl-ACP biosynthesis
MGLYKPTLKNVQVADLYPRFGFTAGDTQGVFVLDLNASPALAFPSIMTINEPENG